MRKNQKFYSKERIFNFMMEIVKENGMVTITDLEERAGLNKQTARRLSYQVALETEAFRRVNPGKGTREAVFVKNNLKIVKSKILSIDGNIVKLTDLKRKPMAKIELKDTKGLDEGKIVDLIIRF